MLSLKTPEKEDGSPLPCSLCQTRAAWIGRGSGKGPLDGRLGAFPWAPLRPAQVLSWHLPGAHVPLVTPPTSTGAHRVPETARLWSDHCSCYCSSH